MRLGSNRVIAPAVAAIAMSMSGCIHRIGDSCKQNVDCSTLGDRFCDTSAPGGYCTVEGCDVNADSQGNLTDSCPPEAACIRFFTQIADKPCDPTQELDPTACHECAADERCLCDRSDPNAVGCLSPPDGGAPAGPAQRNCPGATPYLGHCAPIASERRWCQFTCNSNSDCRTGYQCRATGTRGAEPVPRYVSDGGVPYGNPVQFCAPSPQSQ
jgi:hypothetical protein